MYYIEDGVTFDAMSMIVTGGDPESQPAAMDCSEKWK